MALSGLEDFRSKVAHDFAFPLSLEEQTGVPLSYSESFNSPDGHLSGRFVVEYSLERLNSHGIISVSSTGLVGQSQATLTGFLQNGPGLPWLALEQGRPAVIR